MHGFRPHRWTQGPPEFRRIEGIPRERIGDGGFLVPVPMLMDEINTIVSSYLLSGGELILPKGLQEEENFLDSINYNILAQSDVGVGRDEGGKGFALVSRSRHFALHVELLDGILRQISSKMRKKIEFARQRVERVGSTCGLASLPAEVLSSIFSYAIYGIPRSSTPRALESVRLSHVCRSFRSMVLADPRFWNDISSTPRKPELGLVEACLMRSKDAPLDIELCLYCRQVVVGVYPMPDEFAQDPHIQRAFPDGVPILESQLLCDKTAQLVTPHIGRWRNLTLQFVDVSGLADPGDRFEPIQGAVLPILEAITERHDGVHRDKFDRTMAYASSWTTPALRSLILQNCLPPSLSGLNYISAFDLNLSCCRDVACMFDVLLKMASLQEFSLDLSNLKFSQSEDEQIEDLNALEKDTPLELNSVNTFKFCCAPNDAADDESFEFGYLRAVLSKLNFPLAERFVFDARKDLPRANTAPWYVAKTSRTTGRPFLLHRFLSGLASRFPKATSCDIFIRQSTNQLFYTTLPIHLPPELKNLTVMSNTQLAFLEEDAHKSNPTISKLETLTMGLISSTDISLKSWMNWLLGCAEQHGGWDAFEKLALFKHLEEKDVFEYEATIMRDKVLSWCTSPHSRTQSVVENDLKGMQITVSFGKMLRERRCPERLELSRPYYGPYRYR